MLHQGNLHCIVYISASILPMTGTMLEALLVDARRLNAESGVTGALIYSDGSFMQYFEGEPVAVAQTYQRILASRRHSRISELMNEPIKTREFPEWHMALAQPAGSELLAIATAQWVVQNAGAFRSAAPIGIAMLRNFWDRRRHLV